ncbi:polysaccharide biosynthesis tyrosine autokinase [Cupriavidus basilensis]|uniref:polysaccharide biosynthesis tyrosine autokinase n=1 Tax=Cupriavidus basilensis TaxID=68895 RepID=UPI00130E124E|nr:polysaccharide biosynthesis tyrosine autokinase [Cupriavidus basilensis]
MITFTEVGLSPASRQPGSRVRWDTARALLDHAGWILAATLFGALCGALYAWSLPAMYQADVLVRPESARRLAPANAGQPADALRPDAMTSRAVLAPVVRETRLDIVAAPRTVPVAGTLWARFAGGARAGALSTPLSTPLAAPLESLSAYAWGGERIDLIALNVPDALLNQPLTLVALGDQRFRLLGEDGAVLLTGKVGDIARGNGVSLKLAQLTARAGTEFVVMRRDAVTAVELLARGLRLEAQRGTATATGPNGAEAGGAAGAAAGAAADAVRIVWRDADREHAAAVVNAVARSIVDTQVGHRREQDNQQLDFVSSELPRVKAELEAAEAALARYRARAGSLQPSQESQSYLSGSIEYQRQISGLRLERARLLRNYMPQSQEVRAIDEQIEQLRGDRRSMDSRRQGLSEAERESGALSRDVKVAEDMYMSLRRQAQLLSLAQSDQSSDVRLVDLAVAPALPVGPNRALATGLAALLGLLAGSGLAVLKSRASRGMQSAAAIEGSLALPMVGEVVFSPEQLELERKSLAQPRPLRAPVLSVCEPGQAVRLARGTDDAARASLRHCVSTASVHPGAACEDTVLHDRYLLARQYPHAPAVEGLRTLRASLHFAMDGAANHIVAITSACVGAGKTFGAVNLAVLAAQAGMRVLVVDADLRRARVAGQFGLEGTLGLADLLGGALTLHDAIQPTAVGGLWLLSAGTRPANPSELLMLPALREVLLTCAAGFDLVLVDTPPILAVADAALVSRVAGATLLFVRAGNTPQEKVAEALKYLDRAHANVIGGVLNGVQVRRSNRERCAETSDYLRASAPEDGTVPAWRIG